MTQPDEDLAPGPHLSPEDRDLEAPDDDAVEQATAVTPTDAPDEVHRGLEVDEWDAIEQATVVNLDGDDDYR